MPQLYTERYMSPKKLARTGRIETWDGKNWKITSDWYVSDDGLIGPMVREAATKYATEKKITTGCSMMHARPTSIQRQSQQVYYTGRY